jgi:hypothetical protein
VRDRRPVRRRSVPHADQRSRRAAGARRLLRAPRRRKDPERCARGGNARTPQPNRGRSRERLGPRSGRAVDGARRFKEEPPILFHSAETDRAGFDIEAIFTQYVDTLGPDVRRLYERYTLVDHAIKVVGVGSVGTRCGVGLFAADVDDMLILQVKEARPSVLERYLGKTPYENQGERVVRGQRLMQAASDVFLGWASSGEHDFYIRQFKDMKASADLESADQYQLREYAHWCAWALATAHARSGDAAAIAGYVGRRSTLDRALLAFAVTYAEQTERDHAAFTSAIAEGKIEAADSKGKAEAAKSDGTVQAA